MQFILNEEFEQGLIVVESDPVKADVLQRRIEREVFNSAPQGLSAITVEWKGINILD
jgi:hypothetical protein